MKKIMLEFVRRGMIASSFGPLVLAIFYLILGHQHVIDTLTVSQVCTGIFSLSLLAFVAGGMNVIYQIERLPIMISILIHGSVLYISYLAIYMLNDWLEWGTTPVLVFTVIFALGYLIVWIVIYLITKKNTEKLNMLLKEKMKSQNHVHLK